MGGIKNAKLLSIFNVSYCHRFASKQRLIHICEFGAINNKTKLNKGASNQPKSDKNTCKHFFDVHEFKAF